MPISTTGPPELVAAAVGRTHIGLNNKARANRNRIVLLMGDFLLMGGFLLLPTISYQIQQLGDEAGAYPDQPNHGSRDAFTLTIGGVDNYRRWQLQGMQKTAHAHV
jgi:hypothetical protein